ncbi:MAG TPA: Gfo/Idh/MocA family oxidoreductase, partial [Ilumatobacter sp.]|nr:Gfo/Idh/MocA family oxidoreductase [Ilumatobacter sp.]
AMTIRLGLLAASRIAKSAIIDPLPDVDGVEVTAIGARDLGRARATADEWGIEKAYGSYEELLADADIDAIYIGTPAALHREWSIATIAAGKHLLVEKPLASNAADAQLIADAAAAAPHVVVMEAFHWRYHPCAQQIRDIVDSGVLGQLQRIESIFDIPVGAIPQTDIRWDLPLGGGATMDLGCYSIQWARWAASADPTELPTVVSATTVSPVPGIDGSLGAELVWPSGLSGFIHSSMIANGDKVDARLVVRGSAGEMVVVNPLAPQGGASIKVTTDDGTALHEVSNSSTYMHQLVAFRDAINEGSPFPSTMEDGVRNMAIIDACYVAAGLEPRPAAS